MFETVGIPVLAAAAAGYDLWWLIRWITTSLKKDLANEHLGTEIPNWQINLCSNMKGVSNEFKVNDMFFKQLSVDDQKRFLDIELSFTVYKELESQDKGNIFRTLNKTTDVYFIEMLNSFGDIDIANSVRETVRKVKGINNSYHQ